MKKASFYLTLAMLLICSSCGKKAEATRMMDNFPNTEEAVTERLSLEYDSLLMAPWGIECLNGELFTSNDAYKSSHFISKFDIKTGKFMGNYASKGQGPGEYLSITGLKTFSGKLFFYDYQRRMAYFSDNDLHSSPIKIGDNDDLKLLLNVYPLSDSLFITNSSKSDSRYAVFNSKGEIIHYFGEQVKVEGGGDRITSGVFPSYYAYNPRQKVLATTERGGEFLQFYNMTDPQHPELIDSYDYIRMIVKVEMAATNAFNIRSEGKGSTMADMVATDKYLICLFRYNETDGKEGDHALLFFNWKGKPVKALSLGKKYRCMAADDKCIYLVGTEPESDDFFIDAVAYK